MQDVKHHKHQSIRLFSPVDYMKADDSFCSEELVFVKPSEYADKPPSCDCPSLFLPIELSTYMEIDFDFHLVMT